MKAMSKIKLFFAGIVLIIAWSIIALVGAYDGWWLERVAEPEDAATFMSWVGSTISEKNLGNAAVVLIENGEIFDTYYSTLPDAINEDTLFPTASLSKWI